jgi:chromosome segregation ATPase
MRFRRTPVVTEREKLLAQIMVERTTGHCAEVAGLQDEVDDLRGLLAELEQELEEMRWDRYRLSRRLQAVQTRVQELHQERRESMRAVVDNTSKVVDSSNKLQGLDNRKPRDLFGIEIDEEGE